MILCETNVHNTVLCSIGITDHLTNSFKYSCLDVCGTTPWLSYDGSDNEASSDS